MTHSAMKTLFVTDLTDTSTTDKEGVGTLRWDGANCYRWVYNATESATVVGEVVCHDMDANPDSTLVESVYAAATADLGMLAGVCMSIIASESYGWIQVFGVCTSVIVAENTATITAIGDYLIGVDGAVHAFLDSSVQPQYSRNFQALESLTSTLTTTTMMVYQGLCLTRGSTTRGTCTC